MLVLLAWLSHRLRGAAQSFMRPSIRLADLDDRTLEDIGIRRGEIDALEAAARRQLRHGARRPSRHDVA